jgi:hypothetical protein
LTIYKMRNIRRLRGLIKVLLDRTLGVLIGQRCELCNEFTTERKEDKCFIHTITWCLVCFNSELRRHGW